MFVVRPIPIYPAGLVGHADANVVTWFTLKPDCTIDPTVTVLAMESNSPSASPHIVKAIEEAVAQWTPNCANLEPDLSRGSKPSMIFQQFRFGRYDQRYVWTGKSMDLKPMLALMDAAPVTTVPIDTRALGCPKIVNVALLMPHRANLVTGIEPNSPLAVWLAGMTLKKNFRLDLIGARVDVNVPCAVINIQTSKEKS